MTTRERLDRLREEFWKLADEARALDLSPAQLAWKPQPDRWSVGQIFEHLALTGDPYLPKMRSLLDAHAGEGDPDLPYRNTFLGRFIIKAAGPDGNAPVPKIFLPTRNDHDARVVDAFVAQQETILDLIARSYDAPILRLKVASPAAKFLKFTFADVYMLLAGHGRHHLNQVRALTADPGFPAA
ncbi:MAG: DinB family protein [Fimbriimonadaceae bacterium]|nr:DinB family protein [Fimbriimonadaceae bacterium]